MAATQVNRQGTGWLTRKVIGYERALLIALLRRMHWRIAPAARYAGRNRTEFYRLLARHKIIPSRHRKKKAEVADANHA